MRYTVSLVRGGRRSNCLRRMIALEMGVSMKRFCIVLFASVALAGAAVAAPRNSAVGLGVFLGEPTGLSLGIDLNASNWLDFKAAWSFQQESFNIILQGNYELGFPGALVIEGQDIVPFVGIGAEAVVGESMPKLGLRIPFGLDYRFAKAPLELFLEFGVGIYLFPETKFLGSGGLGLRYRFK